MAQKFGIFGGTFDPIHEGHLAAARAARDVLQLEGVLFVVANQPWQKVGTRELTPAAHRLEMVKLALVDEDAMQASKIEIDRGGVSYTIDTVEELHKNFPLVELYLLVGSEIAETLSTWHRYEDLQSLVTLAIFPRPGYAQDLVGWKTIEIPMNPVNISSTQIRSELAAGNMPSELKPAVASYIKEQNLYNQA
jgi:nicotinate-nucleotide adenylyltransferase